MKFSVLCLCALIGAGMWIAVSKFQYLLAPIKVFYYFIVPVLCIILLASKKQLKFADTTCNVQQFNNNNLNGIQYFIGLVVMQILFYMMTFWIFGSYIYQTQVSFYLQPIEIVEFIGFFQQYPLLYTALPFTASACYGIGLLYFVVCHNKSPFLTECFYTVPKKATGLFIHATMIAAESYSYIVILYLIFMQLLLIANNSLSLIVINFAPLSNPMLYIVFVLPLIFVFKKYNKDIIGLLVRRKYSLGFTFGLLAIIFFLALTLINVFFEPLFSVLTTKNLAKYATVNKPFSVGWLERFELLLLGWFCLSIHRFGSIIGRFSYGFTMRKAITLNLLAITLVGAGLKAFTVVAWQRLYAVMTDPFWLFYSSLLVTVLLWLYGCYIKDRASLWAGPMAVFPSIHLKKRTIITFLTKSLSVLLILVGGAGFMGWRFSQYLVTVNVIYLLPIYIYFALLLAIYLIKDKILQLKPVDNHSAVSSV